MTLVVKADDDGGPGGGGGRGRGGRKVGATGAGTANPQRPASVKKNGSMGGGQETEAQGGPQTMSPNTSRSSLRAPSSINTNAKQAPYEKGSIQRSKQQAEPASVTKTPGVPSALVGVLPSSKTPTSKPTHFSSKSRDVDMDLADVEASPSAVHTHQVSTRPRRNSESSASRTPRSTSPLALSAQIVQVLSKPSMQVDHTFDDASSSDSDVPLSHKYRNVSQSTQDSFPSSLVVEYIAMETDARDRSARASQHAPQDSLEDRACETRTQELARGALSDARGENFSLAAQTPVDPLQIVREDAMSPVFLQSDELSPQSGNRATARGDATGTAPEGSPSTPQPNTHEPASTQQSEQVPLTQEPSQQAVRSPTASPREQESVGEQEGGKTASLSGRIQYADLVRASVSAGPMGTSHPRPSGHPTWRSTEGSTIPISLNPHTHVRLLQRPRGEYRVKIAELEPSAVLLRHTLERSPRQNSSSRLLPNTVRVKTPLADENELTKVIGDAFTLRVTDGENDRQLRPRGMILAARTASSLIFDVRVTSEHLQRLAVTQPPIIYKGANLAYEMPPVHLQDCLALTIPYGELLDHDDPDQVLELFCQQTASSKVTVLGAWDALYTHGYSRFYMHILLQVDGMDAAPDENYLTGIVPSLLRTTNGYICRVEHILQKYCAYHQSYAGHHVSACPLLQCFGCHGHGHQVKNCPQRKGAREANGKRVVDGSTPAVPAKPRKNRRARGQGTGRRPQDATSTHQATPVASNGNGAPNGPDAKIAKLKVTSANRFSVLADLEATPSEKQLANKESSLPSKVPVASKETPSKPRAKGRTVSTSSSASSMVFSEPSVRNSLTPNPTRPRIGDGADSPSTIDSEVEYGSEVADEEMSDDAAEEPDSYPASPKQMGVHLRWTDDE